MQMNDRTQALIELRDAVKAGDMETLPWRKVFGWDATLSADGAQRGSLDAAKVLHEAVLPGWRWKLDQHYAEIWERVQVAHSAEFVDNPARAWLLAILEAIIAQEQDQ